MLHQLHSMRMIYQRVSRNARFGLVGFGKATVNHQQLAVGLYGAFAFNRLYRYMSVDDV